jgi:predicted transcriptional regulator of viral defense system
MPPDFERLYLLASGQQGCFTASQASSLGYSQPNQAYHLKSGDWQRLARGIYRLTHYPYPKNSDLVVTHLWALDTKDEPTGVFSHETALQIYELSDWTGYGLHLTVPPNFRRRSRPPYRLTLHKAILTPDEVKLRNCYLVTTPLKTILDLLLQGLVEQRFLKQSMIQALDRGLILERHLQQREFTDTEATKLSWLLDLIGVHDVQVRKRQCV